MKKRYLLVGLLAAVFVSGVVLGVFFAMYMWQTTMNMMLVEASYELQLQYVNETAIESYEWGEFSSGEQKHLNCTLVYLGNTPASVKWDMNMSLPSGWNLTILRAEVGFVNWPENELYSMSVGESVILQIRLTEAGAVAGKPETFNLFFYSGYEE